jgi:CubicO group peptidase (beta-lactamase class C family)
MNTFRNPPGEADAEFGPLPADRVQAIAQDMASAARLPGLSIAVATPDKVLYAGAVGYADLAERRRAQPEDQFLWFSMTKIATATAAMTLHEKGILDVDAPIGTYLPEYRPHERHGHPTMRQLLTHTAGLANPLPVRWVRPEHQLPDPTWLSGIVQKHGRPSKAVGSRAAYSNIGYLLAGEVMQAASGYLVQECVQDLVLNPLGMTATGYEYDRAAPRAVGYVRMPQGLRPALRRILPDGVVGGRVGKYTSLKRFWSTGPRMGALSAPPQTPHDWPRHTPPQLKTATWS